MHLTNPRLRQLAEALGERRALKVIAGIGNTDLFRIEMVVKAAATQQATAVDVAATADIVRQARSQFDGALFASAIEVAPLLEAADAGADVLEVGNFDYLYEAGDYISAERVLALTEALIEGLGERFNHSVTLSVTIPGHLSLDAQLAMARRLEAMGVWIVQSEGAARQLSAEPSVATLSREDKFAISVRNAQVLAEATDMAVLCATGVAADTIAEAVMAGAAGYGLGRAINTLTTQTEMEQALVAIQAEMVRALNAAELVGAADSLVAVG